MHTDLFVEVPTGFRFESVVYSHGWSALSPFGITEQPLTLTRTIALRNRSLVSLAMTRGRGRKPNIRAHSVSRLSPETCTRIQRIAASMMQTECNLQPFYDLTEDHPRLSWAKRAGAGRMLRGQTFFEDTVKTILTTNCSWSLTTSMNNNLIKHFGPRNSLGYIGFPSAEAIANSTPAYLRRECKLGYRAEYIFEFAQRCASGSLDIESFRTSTASAHEVFNELRSIKGVGAYAAANLMRMLGKFTYLGLDSWCRNKIAEIHGNGVPLPDSEIEKMYQRFGDWKGLAMWLDVTRQWYYDKFPLQ